MKKTNKKNPLITLGLATYQGEKFIKKSLISILNQTYKNTEIIICDDNSSDKTLEICKNICKKKDVKILKNPTNIGAQKNIVKILNIAKGEFFVWVSQDDIYEKDFLQKLVALYEKNTESILIGCGVEVFDDFGKKKIYQSIDNKILKKSNIEISKYIIIKKEYKGEKIKCYLILGIVKTNVLKEILNIHNIPILNIERIIVSMFPFYGRINYTSKVLINKYSNPLPLFKRPERTFDGTKILRSKIKYPTLFNLKVMVMTALKSKSLNINSKISIFRVSLYYFLMHLQNIFFINLVKILKFILPFKIYNFLRQKNNFRKNKLS